MTIVLTGGGTAGHVMPHIALLPLIKHDFDSIHYIGGDGMEKDIIAAYPEIVYHRISCAKLDRSSLRKNLSMPLRVIKGVRQSRALLQQIKPDVIFSKGGFVALPVVLAAKKIPVVTHESDLSMGLANRLTVKKCRALLTSFEDTASRHDNGIYTGAPIRGELQTGRRDRALASLGFSGFRPILLVMGGSLGSVALNAAIRKNLAALTARFDIVHLTGKGNLDPSIDSPSYRQIEFTTQVADILKAADIVISRAGSNAVMELMSLNKPVLLIPLPKGASRGDQLDNAEYLRKRSLAHVLLQEDVEAHLLGEVNKLYDSRNDLITEIKRHCFDGTQRIYQCILAAAKAR